MNAPDPEAAAKPEYKGDYVSFKPPSAFIVPEITDESKPLTLVCDFKVNPDGTLCMTKLGNTPMPEKDEKKEREAKAPSYKDMADGIVNDMTGSMGDSGGGSPTM
jgi:hypothetical protein